MRYRLSKAARADMDRLYLEGIMQFGLRQADAYLDELEGKFLLLCDFPEAGSDASWLAERLRKFPQASHVIYYRSAQETADIIRVLPARMDVKKAFGR